MNKDIEYQNIEAENIEVEIIEVEIIEKNNHSHPNTKAVSNRLAKAAGHLNSVKNMVDRGESCTDVLTQLIAVRSAINNAAKIIMVDHLNECIVEAAKNDDYEKIEEFEKIIKSFVK